MNRIKNAAAFITALIMAVGGMCLNACADSQQSESSVTRAALDKAELEDGDYRLSAEMIKTDRESYSMSNNAINHTVLLTVENGEYYITVQFLGLAIYNQFGYLQTLSYFDEGFSYNDMGIPQGDTVTAEVLEYYDTVDMYNDADHLYPKVVRFRVVDKGAEFIPLQVFVPIMEAISEGTGTQPVLMKPDWSTLEKTDNGLELIEEEKQSSAADLTDDETGVTVHADEGVFPEGTKLKVTPVTEGGESYDEVSAALGDFDIFKAYEIEFLSGGESVTPNGKYTLSLPLPQGISAPEVYRISEGKKTLVSGSSENGVYTVTANRTGIFAVAGSADGGSSQSSEDNDSSSDTDSSAADGDSTSPQQQKGGSPKGSDDSSKADVSGKEQKDKTAGGSSSATATGSGSKKGSKSSTGGADDKKDTRTSTSGGKTTSSGAAGASGTSGAAGTGSQAAAASGETTGSEDNANPESGLEDDLALSAAALAAAVCFKRKRSR